MYRRQVAKWMLVGTAVAVSVLATGSLGAAEAPKALYLTTIETYPAPKLDDVDGREFKYLFDASKTKPTLDDAFKDLWSQVRTSAVKHGFTVTEKAKDPLKVEMTTKEYFDTKDQLLWSKGYIIRITTRFKDAKPNPVVAVTVKSVFEDAMRTLATPLVVVGADKVKTEAEGNVGFVPGGKLAEYVEKGSSFSVPVETLGKFTLGEFAKYMPELLNLGLPADTVLTGKKAYSYRIKPGAIVLPGIEPSGVSMEAWSATEGGTPYLYDFSFGYGDVDFYAVGPTHAAGEQFMIKVIQGEMSALGGPESDKWGGSKVRKLMNRPVTAK